TDEQWRFGKRGVIQVQDIAARFRVRRGVFIAQSEVESEPRGKAPIVLHERCVDVLAQIRLPRPLGTLRRLRKTEEEIGERVAILYAAAIDAGEDAGVVVLAAGEIAL